MRKSTIYLAGITLCAGILVFLLAVHPMIGSTQRERAIEKKRELVGKLGLTDLCLFTEARYTRHLSQADLSSAFQDYPMSLEHFPSGSLTLPGELSRNRLKTED
jgi:hypothetical protein